MIRAFTFLLLLFCAPLVAQDEVEFVKDADKTARAVAKAHSTLASWSIKRKMYKAARELLNHTLELVPEHEGAMKELGYRQKKVDGEDKWVMDERFALPEADGESTPDQKATFTREYARLKRESAVEYVRLGRQAEKAGLATHARVAYEQAVKYDPSNEDALKGAGWEKDELGDWVSPHDVREQKETLTALSDAPPAEPTDELPDWTARVFKQSAAIGVKSGTVTVIGSSTTLPEAAKFANAASKLAATLLGGKADTLRVVLAANATEHADYCATRHPGVPGLVDSRWVIGEKEVEALLDAKDDRTGYERVVYAVAIFEVRRRCGETTHPWFEVGFASNLTRRLVGRVQTAEFSGEALGPSESGRWKRTLKMMVADGNAPKFDKLVVARDPDEAQVILAHFMVRYMCAERRAALPDYCAARKSAGTGEEALKTGFDNDTAELEKLFVDWFARN